MLVFSAVALAEIVVLLQVSTIDVPGPILAPAPQCIPLTIAPARVVPTARAPLQGVSNLLNLFAPPPDPAGEDNTYWGDSINDDPAHLHRIYFQNVDGLRHDSDEIALYVSSMAQLQVGTFCWADPGLDFSKLPICRSLQRPISHHFSSARSAFSSCSLPETALSGSSGYQPSGTFMTSTG